MRISKRLVQMLHSDTNVKLWEHIISMWSAKPKLEFMRRSWNFMRTTSGPCWDSFGWPTGHAETPFFRLAHCDPEEPWTKISGRPPWVCRPSEKYAVWVSIRLLVYLNVFWFTWKYARGLLVYLNVFWSTGTCSRLRGCCACISATAPRLADSFRTRRSRCAV